MIESDGEFQQMSGKHFERFPHEVRKNNLISAGTLKADITMQSDAL